MMTSSITHIVALVLALSAIMGINTSFNFINQPSKISLEITQLEYVLVDGKGAFRQQISSLTGKPVSGAWSVQITRTLKNGASKEMCSGNSDPGKLSTYSGDIDIWLLDDWTGDDCPDVLLPGDRAEVLWTYTNEHGIRTNIGTTYTIGDGWF